MTPNNLTMADLALRAQRGTNLAVAENTEPRPTAATDLELEAEARLREATAKEREVVKRAVDRSNR